MAGEKDDFLARWSRRKLEAAKPAAAPADPAASAAPVQLPSLESLTFESDFKAFMQSKVEEGVKRAALKKLFSDPRFNIMDGLDVYIDDYSKDDPIPQAMLEQLEHAKSALRRPPAYTGEAAAEAQAPAKAQAPEPSEAEKESTPGKDA